MQILAPFQDEHLPQLDHEPAPPPYQREEEPPQQLKRR